jgi:hypothetical protein
VAEPDLIESVGVGKGITMGVDGDDISYIPVDVRVAFIYAI